MHIGDKLKIEIITTDDGSPSLYLPHMQETYHSKHGAVREAMHVFIVSGLHHVLEKTNTVQLLEIGFGTGLNAALTLSECMDKNMTVHYTSLENTPLPADIYNSLDYGGSKEIFLKLHEAAWDTDVKLNPHFTLHKVHNTLQQFAAPNTFNLVYYDAFGPPAQPEMWTPELFKKTYSMMSTQGVLVTYCAKGQVRRDLQSCGFLVERLAGPPGKREMIRATKP